MTDFEKDYIMGQCTVAANEYNEKHNGEYIYYVVRFLAPNHKNISKYESIPIACFKENPSLNNHCFLLGRNKLITDPMYKLKDFNLKDYVSFLSRQLILNENGYYIMDFQELNEKYRKQNRSQFENNYPYFGVFYDSHLDEMTML